MYTFKQLSLIVLAVLVMSCGKNSDLKSRNFSHLKDPVASGEDALLFPAPLDAKSKILEYKSKAPKSSSKNYLTIQEQKDESGSRLIISANHLFLTPKHEQKVWELIEKREDLETLTLEAYEIELDGLLKLPVKNLIIRAKKFKAHANSQIDLRPLPMLEAAQGEDGKKPYRATLTLLVDEMDTQFDQQVVFNASGAKGQKAGAGIPGNDGRRVRKLSGNIVQKCKLVCLMSSRDVPGGGSMFSFQGAQPESICLQSKWQCDVKKFKWPTHGTHAQAPGKPGPGGDAALIKTSSYEWIKHIKGTGGLPGDQGQKVSGGQPGSPNPAIQIKGKKKIVKKFKKGRDAHPPQVDLKSLKGRNAEFLQKSFKMGLSQMEQVFTLRFEYLKDLYISGHFDAVLPQMQSLVELLKQTPEKSASLLSLELKAGQLLTRLYQGLDYFKMRRASAPTLSLEATGLNFKSEMKRSLRFSAFKQWMQAHQKSHQKIKLELLKQQEALFEEKQKQIKRHAKATQKLTNLQRLNSQLERQYQLVKEKFRTQKDEIAQRAMDSMSAKEHSSLQKALRSAAALASVIPVGQPAAGLVAQSLTALTSLRSAQGRLDLSALPDVLDTTIRDYRLDETLTNWHELVSRYRLSELQGLNQEELKKRLKEIFKLSRPVFDVLNEQIQTWKAPKLTHSAYELEVNRLKEVSSEFKQLAREIQELSEIRSHYLQELNLALEVISDSQTKVAQIIEDIALLSPKIALSNDQLNPSVLKLLEKREQNYQEQLLSYQAQLARAYQYKNLKSYPHKLNLEKTQKYLTRIMQDKDNASLSAEELQQVEMIYIEQLSSIFKDILDSSTQKGPRHEKTVLITLTSDEKFALAQGKSIYLNLTNRGVYSQSEEEILIELLKVAQASVKSQKPFDLKIEHEGRGLLQKNGEDYYFNYETRSGRSLFRWGHHFDPTNQHNSGHRQLIARERNLFLSFMADTVAPQMNESLDLYTRPAGKASLKLEVKGEAPISLRHLELELAYSFYERD